jgi:hypothetical protein
LGTQIYAQGADDTRAGGAIRRLAEPPPFGPGAFTFGLALSDDALNQLLWALWYGGGLEVDSADLQPLLGDARLAGVELSLSGLLPPVVMPGRHGRDLDVGLGDLHVRARVDLGQLLSPPPDAAAVVELDAYVSLVAACELDLDPTTNELAIHVGSQPDVYVQIVESDDPSRQADLSDVLARALQALLPGMLDATLRTFPLPSLDLGSITGLPVQATWQLHQGAMQREAGGAEHEADFYLLTGTLR